MKLNPTIKKNITRRKVIVDDKVYTFKNIPMPTWVELSLIDVCNRSCSFCPKSDPSVAPDTFQMMSRKLIDKVHDDLKSIILSKINISDSKSISLTNIIDSSIIGGFIIRFDGKEYNASVKQNLNNLKKELTN